jgi:hypothetical protein
MKKSKAMGLGAMLVAMLLLSTAFVVVSNAQGQDSGGTPAIDGKDAILYDAQFYASDNHISTEEAVHLLQLQKIAGELNAELSMNETGSFAGLWIEHKPKFKVVVQFTRNGEEIIKSYMKQYPDLAGIVEVRNVKDSYADLKKAQLEASSSVSASGIPADSNINISGNTVELNVVEADRSRFDNAVQIGKIKLSEKVKVISVKALAEKTANIYGGLSLSTCTSGFSVVKGIILKTYGITTAGHCSNTQSYNGNSLTFQSELNTGNYDIQWHTAPGYTVTNKIQMSSQGATRDITGTISRSSQSVGNYVCKYGKTTGWGCGYIRSTNLNGNYIWVSNTAGSDDLAEPGDSGGPWFLANDAYGTMTAKISPGTSGTGADGVYMAVDYISGLGVSVMTSP